MSIKYFNKNEKTRKYHFLKVFLSDLKTLSIRNKIETISPLTVHGKDSTPAEFFWSTWNSLSSMATVLPSFSCELRTVNGIALLIHRMGAPRLMQYTPALLDGTRHADVHNSCDVFSTGQAKRFRFAFTKRGNALPLERPRNPYCTEDMIPNFIQQNWYRIQLINKS